MTAKTSLPAVIDIDPATADDDAAIRNAASDYADLLTAWPVDVPREHSELVETIGAAEMKEAAHRSKMLKQPIRKLAASAEDGGPVATSLVDLRLQMERLDPAKFDFEPGMITSLISKLPFVGSPVARYFMQYESAQTMIDQIIKSIEEGSDQLRRDNLTLTDDQKVMRADSKALAVKISLASALKDELEIRSTRAEREDNAELKAFIDEQLIFPLNQHIQALYEQQAADQQGVLAIDIIIDNNKELIKASDRAVSTTVKVLDIAVTLALALANQKIALDKIDALNATTSRMMADNARRLKTQGVAIQKQAASSQLDLDLLKQAYSDIYSAMEDLSSYRQNALPEMSRTIAEFAEMTDKGEKAIANLERGRAARRQADIDPDGASRSEDAMLETMAGAAVVSELMSPSEDEKVSPSRNSDAFGSGSGPDHSSDNVSSGGSSFSDSDSGSSFD